MALGHGSRLWLLGAARVVSLLMVTRRASADGSLRPIDDKIAILTFMVALHNVPIRYSPDGRFIYFNSERTGLMQIWRMKPDGSDQEQVTSDEYNNWFPHPSPDGRYMVFLSYEKDVTGHPKNKDVTLRRMSLPSNKIDVLARCFGGQGTINVNSWSPDSERFAYVSYDVPTGGGIRGAAASAARAEAICAACG